MKANIYLVFLKYLKALAFSFVLLVNQLGVASWFHRAKKSSFLLNALIILSLISSFSGTSYAQCTVEILSSCDGIDVEACAADGTGAQVSWTEPEFSLNCGGETTNYDFVMSFDLPESTTSSSCWTYSGVQRVGVNGGELRINQSSGGGEISFSTPGFYLLGETQAEITLYRNSTEAFYCDVFLLDGTGTRVGSSHRITIQDEAAHPADSEVADRKSVV